MGFSSFSFQYDHLLATLGRVDVVSSLQLQLGCCAFLGKKKKKKISFCVGNVHYVEKIEQ